MMDAFHANLLLLQSRGLSTPPRPFDCAIRLLVSGGSNGGFESANAELLFAHSHILALKSQSLRAQLEQSPSVPALQLLQQCPEALGLAGTGALGTELRQINLDLSTLDNGLEPFKQFLAFLYGETPNSNASPEHLLFLSKLLAVPELGRLLSGQAAQPTEMAPTDFACSSNSTQSAGGQQQMNGSQLPFYAACMQLQSIFGKSLPEVASTLVGADAQSQSSPSFAASLLVQQPRPASDSPESQSVIGMAERRESASSGSSLPSSVVGPASELLVPSNDKEGWCRNKKYIQIVKKGYRCLLCNKVYGRYNSVSYHVTIYHRNPPIRCEEQGCQFTTREARYIHFHKYYRHQIALPESIDLASRKCPLLGCKHVSKSPAMLDKHVQRHVADCLKEGVYFCQMCSSSVTDGGCPQFTANTHELMYQHLLGQHSTRRNPDEQKAEEDEVDDNNKHQQDQQHAIGNGIARLASASAPNTPPNMRFQCDGCNFKARTLMTLEQHKTQKHGGGGSQLQSLAQLGSMPASFSALFGGLFPAAGFASSLPGSPLSPTNSTLAGGLFPPPSSLPLLDHQQQSNAQQLLAQLLTAQKFASALLSSSSSQQNLPPNGVDKLF